MSGTYQPANRHLYLRAGQWIDRPSNWISCDLDGTVSADGRGYSGRVVACPADCTWFRVALLQSLP